MAALYAKIDLTGTGDQTLIPGISGQVININSLKLTFRSSDDVDFLTVDYKSGSTSLTGPMTVGNPGFDVGDYVSQNPWFVCATGQSFVVGLSNTTHVTGTIYYTQA